jgi:hypothetical protein
MATPIPKRLRKAPARAARLSRNVTGSHESNGNESEDQAAERIDHELRYQMVFLGSWDVGRDATPCIASHYALHGIRNRTGSAKRLLHAGNWPVISDLKSAERSWAIRRWVRSNGQRLATGIEKATWWGVGGGRWEMGGGE